MGSPISTNAALRPASRFWIRPLKMAPTSRASPVRSTSNFSKTPSLSRATRFSSGSELMISSEYDFFSFLIALMIRVTKGCFFARFAASSLSSFWSIRSAFFSTGAEVSSFVYCSSELSVVEFGICSGCPLVGVGIPCSDGCCRLVYVTIVSGSCVILSISIDTLH